MLKLICAVRLLVQLSDTTIHSHTYDVLLRLISPFILLPALSPPSCPARRSTGVFEMVESYRQINVYSIIDYSANKRALSSGDETSDAIAHVPSSFL